MTRMRLFTAALAALVARCVRATDALFPGACRIVAPTALSFRCQAAAFGAVLPPQRSSVPLPLVLATGDGLACTPEARARYHNAVVLVHRGGCIFQQKLQLAAAAGARGVVIINTDDETLQLGTLEFEPSSAFAVSTSRSDGDQLWTLVNTSRTSANVEIRSELPALEQMSRRIEYLMKINAPLVAVETFYAALPPPLRDVDAVIASILDDSSMAANGPIDEFLQQFVGLFRSKDWDFAKNAALHAAVGASALAKSRTVDAVVPPEVYKTGAMALLGEGYYAHAATLLKVLQHDSDPAIQCLSAFVAFLRGDLSEALDATNDCGARRAQFNVTAADLDVPHTNFLRLVRIQQTSTCSDRDCLSMLTAHDRDQHSPCCRRRTHQRTEGEETSSRTRHTFWYASPFVEELHHAFHVMGVFLDELGAFHESLLFFDYASRLCEGWSHSTEFRKALAIPMVFDSIEAMDQFLTQLQHNMAELRLTHDQNEGLLSSLTGVDAYTNALERPEDAMYWRYTITPPTMFIGYQGRDVLKLQRSVFALRAALFPSLHSRFELHNELLPSPAHPRKRRIAFVSSWFRNHSVGKLLLGIIKKLDHTKFHVMVYRCVHFLRASDELTSAFRDHADSYMELPVHQDDAVALLRHEAIDVLVFPELGMDAWTVFLSHHRLAPVQCVFWGHPITTANPVIDYFITSEYFISDFFEGQSPETVVGDVWPGAYHGSSFSEQVVLFRGLSTFFTNKFPSGLPTRVFERSRLHVPSTARLYVCPQTLMKLHTDFDAVLEGILKRDHAARIVLLSSSTQRVWKEQLRRRFRRRFGEAHRRIVFLSTLPYDDFIGLLATADVVLDPFPFGGGVTTLDALAVGTPVVTLPSAQTVPQLAAGFLRYMGVSDTIVPTVDAFVSLAIAIATDAALRQRLRQELLAHHDELYEDDATLDDWNAFLENVHVDARVLMQHERQIAYETAAQTRSSAKPSESK